MTSRDIALAIRLPNILLVVLAQLFLLIRYQQINLRNLILIFFTLVWVLWGNLDNNVQDFELDIMGKKRPVNTFVVWYKKLSHRLIIEYLVLFISLGVIGLMTKTVCYPLEFGVYFFALKLYNSHLKKLPLVGNIVIAGLCFAVVFIFDLDDKYYLICLGIVLFWLSLLRELIKDKQDEIADKMFQYQTLPILVSNPIFQGFLYAIAGCLTYSLWILYVDTPIFQMIALAGILPLCYYIYINAWGQAALMLKLFLVFGVISILFST